MPRISEHLSYSEIVRVKFSSDDKNNDILSFKLKLKEGDRSYCTWVPFTLVPDHYLIDMLKEYQESVKNKLDGQFELTTNAIIRAIGRQRNSQTKKPIQSKEFLNILDVSLKNLNSVERTKVYEMEFLDTKKEDQEGKTSKKKKGSIYDRKRGYCNKRRRIKKNNAPALKKIKYKVVSDSRDRKLEINSSIDLDNEKKQDKSESDEKSIKDDRDDNKYKANIESNLNQPKKQVKEDMSSMLIDSEELSSDNDVKGTSQGANKEKLINSEILLNINDTQKNEDFPLKCQPNKEPFKFKIEKINLNTKACLEEPNTVNIGSLYESNENYDSNDFKLTELLHKAIKDADQFDEKLKDSLFQKYFAYIEKEKKLKKRSRRGKNKANQYTRPYKVTQQFPYFQKMFQTYKLKTKKTGKLTKHQIEQCVRIFITFKSVFTGACINLRSINSIPHVTLITICSSTLKEKREVISLAEAVELVNKRMLKSMINHFYEQFFCYDDWICAHQKPTLSKQESKMKV